MQLDRPCRQQHIVISWSFWRCKLRDNNMPAFYYMNTRTEYILPGVFGFQPLKIKQNLLVVHNHRLSVYENCELSDETKHLHLLYFIFRSFCHDTIEYLSLIYFLTPTEVPSTRLALIRSSWRDRIGLFCCAISKEKVLWIQKRHTNRLLHLPYLSLIKYLSKVTSISQLNK